MVRRVATAFARLLHWWWRSDRIRVSPAAGRLLRMAPPCFLRIAGVPAEVVARQVIRGGACPILVHHCVDALGPFVLVVRVGADGVVVRIGERELAAADVEVIPVSAGTACSRPSNSCASAPRP